MIDKGFLKKETVLMAYKELSKLSSDHKQGATQQVSAIRYFVAFYAFYKKYGHECNTRDAEDRKYFIEEVGDFCRVNEKDYTPDFYYPLKKDNDYKVGSNFYSQGQVKSSLENPKKVYDYPLRGGYPLLKIQNGIVKKDESLMANISHYLPNEKFKVALVIWLLREQEISISKDDKLVGIRTALRNSYPEDLVSLLVSDTNECYSALDNYDLELTDKSSSIEDEDIKSILNINKGIENHMERQVNLADIDLGDVSFTTALHAKPFLILAGISGTGKSRKVQELAYATCPRDGELDSDPTSPGNYCLIEVKPNWHDSTELLGYYSNLSGKYILTDFIRFVYKAIQHSDVPFFVCLDEMNLAPVEQYFAEYLSVLETRKRIQNEQTGEYEIVSAELITKKSFQNVKLKSEVDTPFEIGDDVAHDHKYLYTGEDLEVVKYIKENGLRLPQNLFVIGTVNMDDTTHQFSRKVIDRAFTIEMNGGDLSSMFDAKDTLSYAETPLEAKYVVPSFDKAQEVLDAFPNDAGAIKEKVPKLLDDVNGDGIFKDTPFRVSYRVENEMVLYFGSLRQFDKESSAEALINKAFLAILLEKILPRVEGDEKAMHCGTDGSSAILTSLQNLVDSFKPEDYKQGDGSLYDIISRKLHEMNERVKTSYFTSFFS